jgi:hypothetical protein
MVFNIRLTGVSEIKKAMKKHFVFDNQFQSFGSEYHTKEEMQKINVIN